MPSAPCTFSIFPVKFFPLALHSFRSLLFTRNKEGFTNSHVFNRRRHFFAFFFTRVEICPLFAYSCEKYPGVHSPSALSHSRILCKSFRSHTTKPTGRQKQSDAQTIGRNWEAQS